MVILRMQATFGCLDGAVLELSDGLNCLVLPNGAGKSTWAAFLTAMFYGVDPAARKSRGRLPVRLQFAPWSGKPMAGTVHLKLETREIVLERTSAARPMDTFRAYDPVTGQAVAGLTGDNCGQVLWGVERAVFLRTAMIGGDLSVTADQALLQRLQNLASTGRESDSARAAAETLKAWKNPLPLPQHRPPARDRGGHFLHQGGAQPRRGRRCGAAQRRTSPGAGRGKREASPGGAGARDRRGAHGGAGGSSGCGTRSAPGDASEAGRPGIAPARRRGVAAPGLPGESVPRRFSRRRSRRWRPFARPCPAGGFPWAAAHWYWRWRRRCWPPKSPCRRLEPA